MAKEEQLRILAQGVEAWNEWREANIDVGIDLIGAYLVGTYLRDANLSYANLRDVNLSRADLSYANLSYTNFRGADIRGADIRGADIRGANFRGADIRGVDLSRTDLSYANFSRANFRGANLQAVQALGTKFSDATLTGACIQNWNLNSKTIFDNVICDYIYLKEDKKERRPSDPNKNFEPGEFAKLVEKYIETVDLIFSNGIDWKAFLSSFQDLRVEYGEQNISIQAIEKKSDGTFVIRLNVPLEADKAEIESYAKKSYETNLKRLEVRYRAELKAKDREIEIYKQKSADILELAKLAANRPINVSQFQGDLITDLSRNITISDNAQVTASGAGAFNLGDLSGTVANTINQLPTSSDSDQPGIKELLTKLGEAISTSEDLDEKRKTKAFKQVEALATAAQNPTNEDMKDSAEDATTMLKGIISQLPATAALVGISQELLPSIALFFGL